MRLFPAVCSLLAVSISSSFLSGCSGITSFVPSGTPVASSLGAIRGSIHGGEEPIVGSHVYLYAATTGGYGGASRSLLTAVPGETASDGTNYYTTTAADGSFSLTGEYSCTPGTQVYVYAVGGNPGAGINSAAGEMAILGQCPESRTLADAVPYVTVNELSTIAAAYSFASFAVDPTDVSASASLQARSNLANAFLNATNLVDLASGTVLTTTPNGSHGVVPGSEINTLANVLAACVNSSSATSSTCTTLFANTPAVGTGTLPTDTAAAAINIAHNPGTNVGTLFNLTVPDAPFQPQLARVPNDWTVALTFSGGGLAPNPSLAVDAYGDVWAGSPTAPVLAEFSSTGYPVSGATGFATPLSCPSFPASASAAGVEPASIAIDVENNVYSLGVPTNAADFGGGLHSYLVESDSSGDVIQNCVQIANNGPAVTPTTLAIDPNGYVYYGIGFYSALLKQTFAGAEYGFGNGTPYTAFDQENSSSSYAVALDRNLNAWIADQGTNEVSQLVRTGSSYAVQNDTTGYGAPVTGNGISNPGSIAIDSLGNAWIADFGGNGISEFNSSRAAVNFIGGGPIRQPSAPYA